MMEGLRERSADFRRFLFLSGMAVLLGFIGGGVAYVLYSMIGAVTNALFYGRASWSFVNPFDAPFLESPWRFLVILIPALGGLVVSLMIRYGSSKISGHGEPETIEAILTSRSRIQPKVGLLKPVSAAVTIGSGGPFGAEGPIIQTGGAVGSLVGQIFRVTTAERKILLASGAAAGMAAILGTPVAAIIFVIELLLFEFRPRSFIPVAIASAMGALMHYALFYPGPLFAVDPSLISFGPYDGLTGLPFVAVLGVLCGVVGSALTKLLYRLEDAFRGIHVNEFYVPILGGGLVGLIGFFDPSILGTGYELIQQVLNTQFAANLAVGAALFLLALLTLKALAWTVALSTGSSGGTLAPLFLMGGAFGAFMGIVFKAAFPDLGLTVSAFAIIGMTAVFAAASRATLASIVFGAEVTGIYTIGNVSALVPIIVGCVLADAVAIFLIGEETVMTGKLARRGLRVRHEYEANLLDMVLVSEVMTRKPRSVPGVMPAPELQSLIRDIEKPEFHMRSFPVVDETGRVVAVITRTDLFRERKRLDGRTVLDVGTKSPITVQPDDSIYTALQRMVWRHVGHLPVVDGQGRLAGYLSRGDIHTAWEKKLSEEGIREEGLHIRRPAPPPRAGGPGNGARPFRADNEAGGIIGKDPARRDP
jgi:H+/Cl- antiporter ClcA/predicted transcriptional regulator